MRNVLSIAAVALLAGSGCEFDEGMWVGNMQGKVVVPFDAATGTIINEAGEEEEVVDVRFIGPVYLGLYPKVRADILEYPHPEIGPVFRAGIPGDTYPYGGTTVGDLRFACLEALQCRVTSNRFTGLDDMVDWFNNKIDYPLNDAGGNPIESGDYLRQVCYDMLNYTTDEEIRITTDSDDDGVISEKDLDFQRNDDEGVFEAEFTIYQQEFFTNDDGEGMTLWGWMDAPSPGNFLFSTCDPQNGFQQSEYDSNFFGGQQYTDLLNQPSQRIGAGDWVVSEPFVYTAPDDTPTIVIDFPVEN